MSAGAWMREDLTTQGYCLTDATVTANNLCLPSETFGGLERRRAPSDPITI